jgi:adenosylhomocysteine nucleosidase
VIVTRLQQSGSREAPRPYGACVSSGRTLYVVATAAEAAHLPAGLDVVRTGLGKTAAAVATAQALAARPLEGLTVVNLGSAGGLRPGVEGVVEPGVVLNHDINAEAVRAIGEDPQERLVVGDGPVVLASGDVFVADPVRRAALAALADVVDMEGYGVAYACRAAGVPVRLVKHVSDQADEGAMAWAELVDASARALADWVAANR